MQGTTRSTAFRHAIAVIRRRLPVLVACAVIVPAVAYAVSRTRPASFQGSASVLVSFKDPGSSADADRLFNKDDAQRFAMTQATIARTPALAARVVRHLRLHETASDFLDRSAAVPEANTDVLDFTVTAPTRVRAKRDAVAYARQFVAFRSRLERGVIGDAIAQLRARRARLHGPDRARLAAVLQGREDALRAQSELRGGGAYYVSASASTPQIAPRTTRDVVLGLALGLLLGAGLAVALEALDTRVRRGREIADALGIPVLGRLPTPRRGTRQPAVLGAPQTPDAEAVRMLRASLALATRDGAARTILVTSGQAGEGKTTTTANLAAALALAGRRVVVVDLDLRNPALGPLLGAKRYGIADVVRGKIGLEDALHAVALPDRRSPEAGEGRLEVLGAGTAPPDPGDFVGSPAVGELLAQLRERADVVLIDTPPLLVVGDGLQLSGHADAVLVVSRVGTVRRDAVEDLARLLGAAGATPLGVVLTGADAEERTAPTYGYYLLPDEPWARAEASRGAAPSPRP